MYVLRALRGGLPLRSLFMGSGFEEGQYSRENMVITIDQLRQSDKHPSTWYRPQLEAAGYLPNSGRPLGWREVGRESWRWHQGEKAGMRLATGEAGANSPIPDSEAGGPQPEPEPADGRPANGPSTDRPSGDPA